MRSNLESELERVRKEEKKIESKIKQRNKKRNIQCGSCEHSHRVADLVAIQTHFYIPPRGCTEGAYWLPGEMQFVCPETGVINRLLFDNCDVPWEERKEYKNNPEEQFRTIYGPLYDVLPTLKGGVSRAAFAAD